MEVAVKVTQYVFDKIPIEERSLDKPYYNGAEGNSRKGPIF